MENDDMIKGRLDSLGFSSGSALKLSEVNKLEYR